ncbi:Elongation factor Ts, mitochondrial [Capsicum baccatum]|uniref:Elongation factor Ts, mitochondrial n=1 Tax=Capsicum baccatum TaxID=33114 RepID=A0A2G2X2H6_CAPBA|nr:Elongation factor Ts, mitochondrial [Capsicum baccatum]
MVFYGGVKRPISIIYKTLNSSICFGHGYSTLRHTGNSIAESRGYFHKHGNGPRTFAVSIKRYSSGISSSEQMNLIKLLRERTKAAQKDLRKRGIVLASKKSSRTAAEGLLALAQNEKKAVVIELNCETDFVARNEASSLAKLALLLEGSGQSFAAFPVGHLEKLKLNLDHPKLSGEKSVPNAITEVAAMMGENVKLRRGFAVSAPSLGVISTYQHTSPHPGNQFLSLYALTSNDIFKSIDGHLACIRSGLAMHVVAAKPLFLMKEDVCSDALPNEREILKSQEESSRKPQIAIEKMVEGRLRKYFEEVVLMTKMKIQTRGRCNTSGLGGPITLIVFDMASVLELV